MAYKSRPTKPGAERSGVKPDVIITYVVPNDTEKGLLEYLYAMMPERKRTTVKDFLRHNQVMVNDNITHQWDMPLSGGETIRINTTREWQTFSNPRLSIVYEDDDIIVVNKGYGLLSMGTDTKREGTAYSILRDWVKRNDPRSKLFIVHRLDQTTSGLMMFAKTLQAKEAMQYNWNNMVLERRYVAVIVGALEPAEGTIRSYLAENSAHEMYSVSDPSAGQLAITDYKTLRVRGAFSLVELQLATGRKNQIRVHMKEAGHPIVGDRRYGAQSSPIRRVALHAMTLRFVHPTTRRDMNFSTPIPDSFRRLV